MTSPLAEVRSRLAEALSDGLTEHNVSAYSVVPETVSPPGVFVSPGQPYLTREGAAFGGEVVNLEVTVVAEGGLNDYRADQLDELLLATLDVLYALEGTEGFEWLTTGTISGVVQVPLNATGDTHLAATISVSHEIHR